MSFASTVKTNLARQIAFNRKCLLAELSAIVRVCGTIKLKKGGIDSCVTTENAAVARLVFTLFKKVFKMHTTVIVKKNRSLKKRNIYEVYVKDALVMLVQMGIIDTTNGVDIIDGLPWRILTDNTSKKAYIKGLFLGSGSINDPEKSYHLEIVTHTKNFAEELCILFKAFDINSKIISRKNNYVVYLKEGDQIVDALNIIGAHRALLSFENTRVVKHMRNKVNRRVNCETANLNKTVNAALRQVSAIEYIRVHMGLDALPDTLAEIASLRLENPDMSLIELGQLLSPALGKSGINHRLKKIETIAKQIMEEKSDA